MITTAMRAVSHDGIPRGCGVAADAATSSAGGVGPAVVRGPCGVGCGGRCSDRRVGSVIDWEVDWEVGR